MGDYFEILRSKATRGPTSADFENRFWHAFQSEFASSRSQTRESPLIRLFSQLPAFAQVLLICSFAGAGGLGAKIIYDRLIAKNDPDNGALISKSETAPATSKADKDKAVVPQLSLLSPTNGSELFAKKGLPRQVVFSWSGNSSNKLKLEIATDSGFKSALPPIAASDSSRAQASLKAGAYFWRISDGASLSNAFSLTITGVAPLNLISAKAVGPGEVRFAWEKEKAEGKHLLQISKSRGFDVLTTEASISPFDGFETVNGFDQGDYFVRIESTYDDLKLHSQAIAFSVSEKSSNSAAAGMGAGGPLKADSSMDWLRKKLGITVDNGPAPTANLRDSQGSDSSAPAALLNFNEAANLISLQTTLNNGNLLLQWLNPNANPDSWQLWCVGPDGSQIAKIQTLLPSTPTIPGTWSTATVAPASLSSCNYLMIESSDGSIQSNIVQYLPANLALEPPQITSVAVKLGWTLVCKVAAPYTPCSSPVARSSPVRGGLSGPNVLLNDSVTYGGSDSSSAPLIVGKFPMVTINPDIMSFSNGQPLLYMGMDRVYVNWNSSQLVQNFQITLIVGSNTIATYTSSGSTTSAVLNAYLNGNVPLTGDAPYPQSGWTSPVLTVQVTALNGVGANAVASAPATYHVCLNQGLTPASFGQAISSVSPTKLFGVSTNPNGQLESPNNPLDVDANGYVDLLDLMNAARFAGACAENTN